MATPVNREKAHAYGYSSPSLMTVQLKCFFETVCILLEYLNVVLYVNVWTSIIQTFQLSEHTRVPMSLDKRT